jgi:hypothetical protein
MKRMLIIMIAVSTSTFAQNASGDNNSSPVISSEDVGDQPVTYSKKVIHFSQDHLQAPTSYHYDEGGCFPQCEDERNQVLHYLADAQKIEAVGELSNGDKIFLCSGLPVLVEQEDIVENNTGVGYIGNRYTHPQVLILKNYEFNKWRILPMPYISKEFFITRAVVGSQGKVVLDFAKKSDPSSRVAQGVYDLKTKMITTVNPKDQKLLFPTSERARVY